MSIRTDQKEKRRWEILHAGLDLFIRRGYAATKISDIAQAVGMSTGLLFHYFASKEKLYEELIRIGIEGPQQMMAFDRRDPLAFFSEVARQILFYLQADAFTSKMFVLMSQAQYSEAIPESARTLLASFDIYTPTVAIMQAGQQAGVIREGDPYALALAYWTSIQGIAEAIALVPGVPCPDSDWIVDIIRTKHS